MKKTYKCKLSAMGVVVAVNGKNKRCEFEAGVLSSTGLRGCVYTTSDKDVQKAIEALSQFKNHNRTDYIWTDDVESMPEPEPITVVEEQKQEVEAAESAPIKRGRKPKAE